MKRLLLILSSLFCLGVWAQDTIPTIQEEPAMPWVTIEEQTAPDTVYLFLTDTVFRYRTDTVTQVRVDSVYLLHTDTVVMRVADTAALKALQEKEQFYRQILSSNGVDKEKLEAERNYYIRMVDSLRAVVRLAELENVRKEEANRYLEERARAAEEKVSAATNKKKKVRPIQGIAMRFYRTPKWEIRLDGREFDGTTTYTKVIRNRNAGSVEFDYVTGASVMLWDLTNYFNQNHTIGLDTTRRKAEIRRFDQTFAYDLGLYVGFGGSNLFKNFYAGASFRFVDFFYLTVGVNVAEYEVLVGNYKSGDIIPANMSIDDLTAKAWLVKPFVSLSIDLDFLSYIKK